MGTTKLLREFIQATLSEIDIRDVQDVQCAAGSTHTLSTCKIGKDKYYMKFSDESLFDAGDPSMQILVEYLAYRVYQLYPGVATPKVDLVFDEEKGRVGLASSAVVGKPGHTINPKALGKMMSSGVYVDIFLANWDAVGNAPTYNVIVGDEATRIDPGGALTYRAQGGRKGSKFNPAASELKSMLDPAFGGAGKVFQHSDLAVAAKAFLSVPWGAVAGALREADSYISKNLTQRGMSDLLGEWKSDFAEISSVLKGRHSAVTKQAQFVVQGGKK